MRNLKALALGLFLTLVSITGASAQCGTQAPAHTFCGNDTGSTGLAGYKAITPSVLAPIAGGTLLGNPTAVLAVPIATPAPVLGIPGTSTGEIGFAGLTNGTAILRAQATAGSAVSLLPTVAGTLVASASAPLVVNATTGNISIVPISSGALLGNSTAGSAIPVETTVTSILDRALGSTRGSILERGASNWGIITPGTAGFPLTSNGAGLDLTFSAISSSAMNFIQNGAGAGSVTFDLLYRGVIVVPEMFGDGVPCSTASGLGIQKAITYLSTIGRGRVQAANCTYLNVPPITIASDGITLEGYGGAYSTNSRISFAPTAIGQCMLTVANGANIVSNTAIRHLALVSTDSTYKTGLCLSDSSTTTLDDVFIRGFSGGLATAVTGAANSGTGEIRLTVAGAAANYNDGYAVMVGGVAGTVEANSGWPIVVADATHIDLKGSTFTNAFVSSVATFTGTCSGSPQTTLTTSVVTGTINSGSMVTGTGYPSNTLILSQTSGPVGGAGVYVTSNACTASAAASTTNAVIIASSTGLQTKGRELLMANGLSISADLPLRMSVNPNFATSAVDTTTFTNVTLGQSIGTNCNVMIDEGVSITNLNFLGTQSWGGGKDGVCWRGKAIPAISQNIRFDNVRSEQKTVAGGTLFNLQPNTTTYSLSINNPLFADRNGVLLRNIANWEMKSSNWLNTTLNCIDIDSTVQSTKISGYWLAGASTNTISGQTIIKSDNTSPTGCLPNGEITYSSTSSAERVQSLVIAGSTDHGLLIGHGTSALTSAGLGTTTTVWHGNASGDGSYGAVANADLTNSATTVNGQTCTLGATCTITAASTGVTVGSTTITSGTTMGVLTNNAGVLGNTAAGTSGQLFLGVTGAQPNWATMSADATITNAGALTIAANAVTLAKMATQATNTVLGNATSGTAVPTALAVGTCSTSSSALIWTTNTGFGCNTSINAATLGSATFAAPGAIGGGTPSTIAATTLTGTSMVLGTNSVNGTMTANGPNSGTNAGSSFVAQNNGTSVVGLGNYSKLITAGAYDGTPTLFFSGAGIFNVGGTDSWSMNGVTASTSTSTGSLVIKSTGGLGVGGAIFSATHSITNMASDTAQTDNTVCINSAGLLLKGTGSLGICLGTSGAQFKTALAPMEAGIDDLMKVTFQNFRYLEGFGDGGAALQYGTTAQEVAKAIPDIARRDASGELINYDSGALLFVGLRAIQQLKVDNDNLRADVEALKKKVALR